MRFLLHALLALFTSCSCLPCREQREVPRPCMIGVEQMIDTSSFTEIIIPFAVELAATRRLRFEDAVVYYNQSAERFRVIFSTQNIVELCEARGLMVDVVEGLLMRMNASPAVAADYGHFPITAEDLELYFSYESYFVEYVDPTYIAWMSLRDGFVYYYDGVIKDFHKDFWNARIEPYYKSLEFVQLTRAAEEAWKKDHPSKIPTGSHYLE